MVNLRRLACPAVNVDIAERTGGAGRCDCDGCAQQYRAESCRLFTFSSVPYFRSFVIHDFPFLFHVEHLNVACKYGT